MPTPGTAISPSLAIVVPVLHDDKPLDSLLKTIADLQSQYRSRLRISVVVVDGAADEGARRLVEARGVYVSAEPSRGGQIAAGIASVGADWYWFLHADTQLGPECLDAMVRLIERNEPCWGRFDIELPDLGGVAWFMNHRSRITRICTGDQGCFVARSLLELAGGFPDQPLMEDIEFSRRMKRTAARRFVPLRARLRASSRRWQRHGVLRTIVFMWIMRLKYFAGVSSQALYAQYYRS